MRFLTSSILLALASSVAINALPTASSSALRARSDDLATRTPLEAFEVEEAKQDLAADEAAEEEEDYKFLAARDLELEERAEELADIEYLDKRDAVIKAKKRAAALQPFEQEEADAEDEEDDLTKRDELLADELAEEMEDEEDLNKRDLEIAIAKRAAEEFDEDAAAELAELAAENDSA